ncbi:enoyl-CoA hydratase [Sciscionella marina]|uniref:enoyl-CoA hydratase n=1 Tax=Sciscionella marina TaxID=508770 RepID=UPI0003793735|nr:enoyl-CoA hydratase [Sciscionella marina]
MTNYQTIILDHPAERVARITLNRPHALNALNQETMRELTGLATELDRHPDIGTILLTGSTKAFAAGADIKEMAPQSFSEVYTADWFAGWDTLTRIRTPLIAAVAGYALGGGCELAMLCDILIAADTAKFGQPEITLGVIPGMGGSQRLTRAIGKPKAMDLCLTGRTINATEAERAGLISRLVPAEKLLNEALTIATTIASMSKPATQIAKEAINRAFETTLTEGILFERRTFHATFATHDQKEGMQAFTEKRQPNFKHQ